MQLNEETYEYMKKASSQIEGITCALGVYIDNTIDIAKRYHYRVYNELLNEIRDKYINAIIQIKDVFESTSDSLERIAVRMKSSESTQNVLRDEVKKFEGCLSRLVIRCENIGECKSSTQNPNIPDADDEIYKCFSRYKQLISDYPLERPLDDDVVSSIIYSFYKESINIYDNLFSEYDKMMNSLGSELQMRKKAIETAEPIKAVGIVKKGKAAEKIARATVSKAIGIIGGINNGEIFTVVDKGIGLLATISEELGDVIPKESLARNALKCVETFGKSMKLIEGIGLKDGFGLDDNTMGAIKLIGASVGIKPFRLHQLNREGKLDSMVATASFTTATISCVGAAISGKPFAALAKLPKVADSGMKLVEAVAKYYGDKNLHELPKGIDSRLQSLAKKIKEHENSEKQYKAMLIRGIPVRKPNAPPWIKIHKGVSFLTKTIDGFEKVKKKYGGG